MFKIGMSFVNPNLCKKLSVDKELAKAVVKEYLEIAEKIKNASFKAELDNMRVYADDMCVICMEDDVPPAIVFFRCGHACVCGDECSASLKQCPKCRATIVSKVKRTVAEQF